MEKLFDAGVVFASLRTIRPIVKLVLAAEAPAEQLYVARPLAHEFTRTVSRLVEMRSQDYLASAHRP